LPQVTTNGGSTTVPLRFEPTQSFFVLFRNRAIQRDSTAANFADLSTVAELSGPWEVAFDPKWGGPDKTIFPDLQDWSKNAENGIRYYSGTAIYRKIFDLPSSGHSPVFLDLGVLKNLAQVRLNDRDLGVVWCSPWRVDVSGAVRPTNNQLEIRVANLWPNRLIGDQFLPPDQRRTSTTWNPFKKDSPLLESGLIGPVTLQALVKATPAP
jgi:(4-O-methyl)-D-glucuronate---lignin esterase